MKLGGGKWYLGKVSWGKGAVFWGVLFGERIEPKMDFCTKKEY